MMLEVTDKVSETDKVRLVEILKEAKQILSKYPYTGRSYTCVRDRAKSSIFDAYEWCSYLESEH
jgi:hypothetical protein